MTASRLAGNIVVLLLLALGIGYVIDVAVTAGGGAPLLSCTFVPLIGATAPTAGLVLGTIGLAVTLLSSRNRGSGILMLLGGLVLFYLPDLVGMVVAPRC